MKNLRNLSFIAIGDGISKVVAFIATPYIAIKLQPDTFGIVGVITSIYTFMVVFVQFGTNEFGILKVSPNRMIENIRVTLGNIISSRLWILLILTPLCIFGIFIFNFLLKYWALIAAGLINLFALSIALDWVFTAIEEMWIPSLIRMLSRIVYAVFIFAFVKTPNDAFIAILIQGIAELFVVLSLWMILYKREAIVFKIISFKNSLSILRRAFPIFLTTVSVAVFGNADVILLGWMKESMEVGYYNAALKVLIIGKSIRITLGPFIFPKVVKVLSISKERSQNFLKIIQVYATAVAIAIAYSGFLYASQIIKLIFGSQYINSAPIFAILIWVAFFDIIGIVYTYFVFSINQKLYAKIIIASSVINIILNTILIRTMGAIGSAISYVISSAMIAIICYIVMYHHDVRSNIWRDICLPVILGVGSIYVAYILVKPVSAIYSSVLGVLAFIALLFLLKVVR